MVSPRKIEQKAKKYINAIITAGISKTKSKQKHLTNEMMTIKTANIFLGVV